MEVAIAVHEFLISCPGEVTLSTLADTLCRNVEVNVSESIPILDFQITIFVTTLLKNNKIFLFWFFTVTLEVARFKLAILWWLVRKYH